MTGIVFEDYIVPKFSYEKNFKFDTESKKINISPDFSCEIIEMNERAEVRLVGKIGSLEEVDAPFFVHIEVVGFFEYQEKESNGIPFENYLTTNAVAILFPYVRSLISDITSRSNEFPSLTMPVINVAKFMLEKDHISYKKVD
ncbi:protein-export chaperone SecB [Planococcus lenghuensis]|uniref:Preprotein translocase subunit SecB n=1 Tax=Planococcus lenghuensis TaxID=2213202 RepID=A0A1Q2L2B7_9BACL|nr:protein-export chaperone SecB [Planococcus lenghuensis]AQQ54187.1 hypothetical protein B0X71_14450 [Planococcus lenghuensis]